MLNFVFDFFFNDIAMFYFFYVFSLFFLNCFFLDIVLS